MQIRSVNLRLKMTVTDLKEISQVYRQLFRFWIHVDSAERLRKTSVCYKQQGIGQ